MKTAWRFFPYAIAAAIGLVVVVNGAMVYAALATAPGKVGEGFALSNRYDTVLVQAEREDALGWAVTARIGADGQPVVLLADRTGAPLQGAAVGAVARRPLGPEQARALAFVEVAAGRYVADAALPVAGQWELTVSAAAGERAVGVTRRVIVR